MCFYLVQTDYYWFVKTPSWRKLRLIYLLFGLLAFMMVLDFFVDKEVDCTVTSVKRIVQSHNNASGNIHFTYLIATDEVEFYSSSKFARSISAREKVKLRISLIFGEINQATVRNLSETYSLRWATGIGLPFVCIVILGISIWRKGSFGWIAILALIGNLFLICG